MKNMHLDGCCVPSRCLQEKRAETVKVYYKLL
jgi:hypothetical protein